MRSGSVGADSAGGGCGGLVEVDWAVVELVEGLRGAL